MDKLARELQRLYFQPGTGQLDPLGQTVRCLLIDIQRSADWPKLARLYEAVQGELDLPAPAVSVSSRNGFRLWFSLKNEVPARQGEAFLRGLCRKYLDDLPEHVIALYPGTIGAGGQFIELPPCFDETVEKWSAFIDPGLGSMFADEAGLDMPPGTDKQASLLAACSSIQAADFARAAAILDRGETLAGELFGEEPNIGQGSAAPGVTIAPVGRHTDPQAFLLDVMNDAGVAIEYRIEAAKVLLLAGKP
ncbi:MAG: hypothetical protein D3M94_01800 [Rhodocyclales bacterium GT-UBC]|nr:MAG: hypothetical protein D3M94_01800 [Rhodocyclales bacterium GT-UBC]